MTTPIHASALRIGMFVHLNVGWMSHPFPLSSFKLTSIEQIETIRSLGLTRLTWSPERSEVEQPAVEAAAAGAASAAADEEEAPRPLDARQLARLALQAQLEIAQRCERQFTEACRDLRRTNDKVLTDPAAANTEAQLLARALLDKMLAEGEPCLRVLGEMASDRHAAHALNVTVISLMLGRQLNVPGNVLMELGVGALMHDVGKVALPDRVRLPREDFN